MNFLEVQMEKQRHMPSRTSKEGKSILGCQDRQVLIQPLALTNPL